MGEDEGKGRTGTRKPDGGSDGDDDGDIAEVTWRRRQGSRQGRRMTGQNGNERGARSLLILALLGNEGENASVDEEGEGDLVESRGVGGSTMLLGKGHAHRCPMPSSSLWTPAAAGAPDLLLHLMLSPFHFSGFKGRELVGSNADEGQDLINYVMMTLSEPAVPYACHFVRPLYVVQQQGMRVS